MHSLNISSESDDSLRTVNSQNPFLEKFVRSAMHIEQRISSLIYCIHHLHHIFDPILFLCYNVKMYQRANFKPRYLEKYVPHLFHFLDLHN